MALSCQQGRGYWGFGELSPQRGVYDSPKSTVCPKNRAKFKSYRRTVQNSNLTAEIMTFFVRLQTGSRRTAVLPPAVVAPAAAPVVAAAAMVAPAVAAAAMVAPAVAILTPLLAPVAAVVAPAAAPVVAAMAAAAVAAAVVAPAVAAVVPAAVATAKKRKHYLCRLKKCPKCGQRATSNRQLACAGDLCVHVYLPPSKYKKAKLDYNVSPQELDDMTIEELDNIFDGPVLQSLSVDMFEFLSKD